MFFLSRRSHILQADTEDVLNAWVSALHKRIDAAIHNYKDYDVTIQNFSENLPGAKRIQKM